MQFPSAIVALARTMDTKVILDLSIGRSGEMKKSSEVRRRREFDEAESNQSEESVICGLAGKKSGKIWLLNLMCDNSKHSTRKALLHGRRLG